MINLVGQQTSTSSSTSPSPTPNPSSPPSHNQADVCHAYQIVHAHGVPDDHIIVMMYDDIAFAKENPTPGKIINHPNGTDVYHGVPKDYVCSSVRPDVFLQVQCPYM